MSWATLSASTNRVAFARLGSNVVTAGAVTGSGFLAINSELIIDERVVMIDYLLTILTSQFGNLAYGDSITIDGALYKVEQEPMRVNDGTFSKIPLMKTSVVIDLLNYLVTQNLATQNLATISGDLITVQTA